MDDLIFVSAQPDIPYFHWQTKVYVHNFIDKGINPNNIHVLFIILEGETPSNESLELKSFGVNVHHYKDTRHHKIYIPTLRPLLLSNWLRDYPQFSKKYFYHDSDIVFRVLPDFNSLVDDDVCYLSDTKSYIGYEYIKLCCERYKNEYPYLKEDDLLFNMCDIVGISPDIVIQNEDKSGGAQYLLKNVDYTFWDKVFVDCEKLYVMLYNYNQLQPIKQDIQIWTSDMWALLWNLWLIGKNTEITRKLSFSWGTDNLLTYKQHPILHMAGVTEDLKRDLFYKADFINKNPIKLLEKNENYFDYIKEDSSTKKYIEVIKTMIKNTKSDYLL